MNFVDENHRNLYYKMKHKVHRSLSHKNLEYDSALYVLAFLQSNGKNVMPYLDLHEIDFPEIRENLGMSTGERCLLDLANACFNGYEASIDDTLRFLSGTFRQVAFEALMHRY